MDEAMPSMVLALLFQSKRCLDLFIEGFKNNLEEIADFENSLGYACPIIRFGDLVPVKKLFEALKLLMFNPQFSTIFNKRHYAIGLAIYQLDSEAFLKFTRISRFENYLLPSEKI